MLSGSKLFAQKVEFDFTFTIMGQVSLSWKKLKLFAIRYILFISLLVFFQKPIKTLLNKLLVQPLFKEVPVTPYTDILLVICVIYVSYNLIRKLDLSSQFNLALFVFIFYKFQKNNGWNFYSTFYYEKFHYWDTIVLGFIIPPAIGFLKFLRSSIAKAKENNQKEVQQGFYEDNPIVNIEQDKFHRATYAQEISKQILNTSNQKSFAIGLLGEFGSGKTSLLNLIEKSLKQVNTNIVFISYNPWSSEKAKNIQKDFFDLLAVELAKINSNISSTIYSYSRRLTRSDSLKGFVEKFLFIRALLNPYNTDSDYETINRILRETNKKVIIAIDDLDRLHDNEVIEVLKLIRNTASFTNFFYVVAYDKRRIENSIKSLNKANYLTYLDKIVQLEIPLPKREEKDLTAFVSTKLSTILTTEDFEEFEKKILKYGLNNFGDQSYYSVFRNSRDIVKFCNSFLLNYPLLRKDAVFKDLFILELLKFRFPLVYELIYSRRDNFLKRSFVYSISREYYEIRSSKEGDKDIPLLINFLKQNSNIYCDDNDLQLVEALFVNLFPTSVHFSPREKHNSISNTTYFEIYFRYRLGDNDLSEEEFVRFYNGSKEAFLIFLNKCFEKEIEDKLLIRLLFHNYKGRENYEKLVHYLFYLGEKYVIKHGFTSFPHDEVIRLLELHKDKINELYDDSPTLHTAFIRKTFQEALPNYITYNEIIFHLKKDSVNTFPIPLSELTNYQYEYLELYLNQHEIDETAIWLFWGIRDFILDKKSNITHELSDKIEEKALDIMKQYLLIKDPLLFIKGTIRKDMYNDNAYTIYQSLLKVFADIQEFKRFVKENTFLQEHIKSKYLEFFELAEKSGFNQPVKFDLPPKLKPKEN